ncbi:MAG: DNA repair protein RecO [Thiotrichales bacterium]|nr:DNA repair protein RecO [Thiotrichales bacterium]
MQHFEQVAWVLHSRPYRETSALVTFFSAEQGKFNAIARSVRGGKKAQGKAALLQPFRPLQLRWQARVTQPLPTLSAFESAGSHFPLQGQTAVCGLYINELLYRLLYPGLAQEALFQDYTQVLWALTKLQLQPIEQQSYTQACALRWFEWHLLDTLGHGIEWSQDAHGQAIADELDYVYQPHTGFWPWHPALGIPQTQAISGRCVQQLAAARQPWPFCPPAFCLKSLRQLLSQALAPHLGSQPIQARKLLLKSLK